MGGPSDVIRIRVCRGDRQGADRRRQRWRGRWDRPGSRGGSDFGRRGPDVFGGGEVVREIMRGATTALAAHLELKGLIATSDRVACEFLESYTVDRVRHRAPLAAFYALEDELISEVGVYREGSADVGD